MKNNRIPYQVFWETYFPEQELISREQALATTGRNQQFATIEELRDYQKVVAPIYGAYELEAFQLASLEKVLPAILRSPGGTLVSLGSGPGAYELWLLSQGFIQKCILIDLSENMLERAGEIAKRLDLTDHVEMICEDISTVVLPEESADVCISINSLHWSDHWRDWVKKAIKYTKPGGLIFLSASLQFPQSQIDAAQFVGVAARGMHIREHDFLLPVALVANQQARSMRYYIAGYKKTRKELQEMK